DVARSREVALAAIGFRQNATGPKLVLVPGFAACLDQILVQFVDRGVHLAKLEPAFTADPANSKLPDELEISHHQHYGPETDVTAFEFRRVVLVQFLQFFSISVPKSA